MLFKDAVNNVDGFRYLLAWIVPVSEPGMKMLSNTPFMTNQEELEAEYDRIDKVMASVWGDLLRVDPFKIEHFGLEKLRDIRGVLERLKRGNVLDDLDLFDIKELAFFGEEAKQKMTRKGLSVFRFPDLMPVINVLDPEKSGVVRFYIYDIYSADLAEVRADMRKESDGSILEGLRAWEARLEDGVRQRLSEQLLEYADALIDTFEKFVHLDVLIAKVEFARLCFLSRPCIRKAKFYYGELKNIEMQQDSHPDRSCQAVDVALCAGATVITGANMSGKSMLLNSLKLAQYLAQFGFFVPSVADIVLVDEIVHCSGDGQDREAGLSSFGAEMMQINRMIQLVKEGKKVLALIDEPARTTNPKEGRAIVNALVDFLTGNKVYSVVTTHYDGITARCRRLRVLGLMKEKMLVINGKVHEGHHQVTVGDIQRYIDYSLVEDAGDEVTNEALLVAELLGVDGELLKKARKYLK